MSTAADTLEITLLGRAFRVACAPGEQAALSAAVDYVDGKLHELAEKTHSSGERLALMTALNLAHELLQTRQASGVDLPEFRRRIAAMQKRLDHALANQEQLF